MLRVKTTACRIYQVMSNKLKIKTVEGKTFFAKFVEKKTFIFTLALIARIIQQISYENAGNNAERFQQ